MIILLSCSSHTQNVTFLKHNLYFTVTTIFQVEKSSHDFYRGGPKEQKLITVIHMPEFMHFIHHVAKNRR